MIKIHQLPKTASTGKKRLGQGHGSGKGKTGGRGTKGQNARRRTELWRKEIAVLAKRLPLIRGKYRNKPLSHKPLIVNLKYLNGLPENSIVDLNTLISKHIVKEDDAKIYGVKILGDGDINIPLIIKLPCSKSAAKKIETAGGKIETSNKEKSKIGEK